MSYKATAEQKLKRFLYLSTEDSKFVSGDPDIHKYFVKEKITCDADLLKVDPTDPEKHINFLRNLFTSATVDPLLPRRETLFYALAKFLTFKALTDQHRYDLYSLLLSIIRNNEDLFNFVKFSSTLKEPFCTGLQKVVTRYYMVNKDPMSLIEAICESNSYHGWSHKDIFKLTHISSRDPVKEVIIKYVLFGEKRASEAAGDNQEACNALAYAQKVKEYRKNKDEDKVAEFISEFNIKHMGQIPPVHMKSQTVWAALIPQLSLNNLILYLPKLYKLGFLKPGSIHTKVIDILSDKEKIESSGIHPIEVFIGLRNLEKGGKPKDPHLIKYLESKEGVEKKVLEDPNYKKPNFAHQEPAKCTAVITALQKTLSFSFANLRDVSKRIMITIDPSDRMNDPCLTTKNVTCMEAAAMLALCLFKANKTVTIAVFYGNTVNPVSIDNTFTHDQIIKKLKGAKHGAVLWSAPFDWAVNQNKAFDVFIHMGFRPNILDISKEEREKDKPKEAFANYMRKMSLPNTRLITYNFGVHNCCFADGATNILDICGFDKNVPTVIDGFCKNLF